MTTKDDGAVLEAVLAAIEQVVDEVDVALELGAPLRAQHFLAVVLHLAVVECARVDLDLRQS